MKVARFLNFCFGDGYNSILHNSCLNRYKMNRHMSDWTKTWTCFTIVLPHRTIPIANSVKKDRSSHNLENCRHEFLFGFNCKQSAQNDTVGNYITSAIAAYNVSRDVNMANIEGLYAATVLRESESRFPLIRGVALYSTNAHAWNSQFPSDENKSVIEEIFRKYGIDTVFKTNSFSEEDEINSTVKVSQFEDFSQNQLCVDDVLFQRCGLSSSLTSPVFASDLYSPVFHSLSRSRSVLEKCSLWMKEAKELIQICDAAIPPDFNLKELKKEMTFPFVVVEGLDATGKTTLTEMLEKKMAACRYYTPPPEIQHLRKHFDDLPEIVRRAYYSIGNYIVAVEILKTCQKQPVIMDRYWHSTTAYGIANETSVEDMPGGGHWAYEWPDDLLTPDLVLFLTVSEEVRKQRMLGRAGEKTLEEKHLDKDQLFRERLYLAYKRMVNPGCVEIDASGPVDSVISAAETELSKHGIQLRHATNI